MASYYKRLKRDLAAAAASGTITPQQADALYENIYAQRLFASFKAAHWISIIAGIFIAGGLSLIIAHNWDKIGAIAKVAVFLAAYAAVAEAAIRWEDKPAVGIPAEVIWFFMPPIGIGLYAQVFQLSGDPVKPFAAWALISLPLAFFTGRRIAAALSMVLLLGVAYFGAFRPNNMFSLVEWRFTSGDFAFPWTHWLAVLLVFCALFWVYFARLKAFAWRDRVAGGTLIWLFIALVSPTFFQLHSPAFILLAAASLTVLWLGISSIGEGPGRLPMLAWFAVVYGMTFFWHYKPSYAPRGEDSPSGVVAALIIFAVAVALTVLRPVKAGGSGKTADWAAKALLLISMVSAFLMFGATEAGAKPIAVIANALIILSGLGLIVSGSMESDEKRINGGVAVIFLIIITRFMDIFGTLMKTGMAFIVSGLVLGALAYFLNKTRKSLIEAANARRQHE
ncbi:MAG: DUF2157 domain-containing protein [Elusimicrobia bacterium]|nr:DUF2157 domain-containing protein [Elusimicrobiota bacterium]